MQVNSFVGAFHDAVILYALALNETLADGYNATDGAEITKRMWNRSFEGMYIIITVNSSLLVSQNEKLYNLKICPPRQYSCPMDFLTLISARTDAEVTP